MHARARRRRRDFAEQASCDLAKNHRLLVFEDLHLAAMTRSAQGTVDNPGRNVARKAGLDRVMLDNGLGTIKARTDDKVRRYGHASMIVPPPGTSITCPVPECGHVDPENRASRSVFVCARCGYSAHPDTNAAIESRKRGIKLACAGGTPATAHQGTNLGPTSVGAEPGAVGAGRGSGNQETGYITVRDVA
ncbi:MAG: zinc ribbon domain-containing protein [Acidimicrobiales bacterium]